MKRLMVLIIVALFCGNALAADSTLPALTADTGPLSTDEIYKVNTAGDTERKATLGNAITKAHGVGSAPGPIVMGASGVLATIADPNADKILGWDDSASAMAYFGLGTGLAFSATPTIDLDATIAAFSGLTITQGSLLYGTGTDAFSVLAKGTAGQLLQMNSGATAPEWTSTLTGTFTFGNADTSAGFIKFLEDSDNGTNTVTLIGPASTADVTLTLPAVTDTLAVKGANTFTADQTMTGTAKVTFGDTGTYVNQSADGTLSLVGDTIVDITAPNIKLAYDAAAYLNIATANAGETTISAVSDGTDAINIGDGVDDEVRLRMPQTTANGTWSGITLEFADCAASLAFGTPVYVQSTGKPAAANAAAASTMPAIGIIVVASTNADDPCTVLTHGRASATAWPTLTSGGLVYIDDSGAGVVTQTVGDVAGTDHVVQVLGIGLSGDTMLVNPSLSLTILE